MLSLAGALTQTLRFWSFKSWTCVQTISFTMVGDDMELKLILKPMPRFPVLSDIDKCLVLVLSVKQGEEGGAMVVISVAELQIAEVMEVSVERGA